MIERITIERKKKEKKNKYSEERKKERKKGNRKQKNDGHSPADESLYLYCCKYLPTFVKWSGSHLEVEMN